VSPAVARGMMMKPRDLDLVARQQLGVYKDSKKIDRSICDVSRFF
jgi:hypothetical protein